MGWVYDESKLTEMLLFFAEGLAGEPLAGSALVASTLIDPSPDVTDQMRVRARALAARAR